MKTKALDCKLIDGVATLLCQHNATHPDFFSKLAEEIEKRGYILECHQRGVQGTYVCISKIEGKTCEQ
jgi:hypothetical protein